MISDEEIAAAITIEYLELANLLEEAPVSLWDAPSLCEGWRTREVVAHMTMPARLSENEFMSELRSVGGNFARLSNALAARDGALPTTTLLADLRSETLHGWTPPGGDLNAALIHVVIHGLDIVEATMLSRCVPVPALTQVLSLVGSGETFGIDLDQVELRATDMDWSRGSGPLVSGPGQVLALIACGRRVPTSRLEGDGTSPYVLA